MKYLLKILMLAALASAPVVRAEVASPSVQIIVMRPTDFPLLTRVAGQSMDLHPFNNGTTYLYIEQQQVDRIVILDVTDPARDKPVGTAKLETPAPFDFINPLGARLRWSAFATTRDWRSSIFVNRRNRFCLMPARCSKGLAAKKSDLPPS